MTEWLAIRPQELARLAALGLRQEHFEFFRGRFVGHPFHYLRWALNASAPHTINKRLTNSTLVRHLEGQAIYGSGCRWDATVQRHRTDYFCVDIDAHSMPHSASLWERYDLVVSAIGVPGFTFRSSLSGGLHLYYFLDASYDLHDLRSPDGDQDGAVIRALGSVGLAEEPGHIEVYPRGRYRWRGQQNRLRLPFGLNSRLLDRSDPGMPVSNGPIHDLIAAYEQFERGDVSLLSLQQLRAVGASVVPLRRHRPRRTHCRRASGFIPASRFPNGLEGEGQFNAAVMDRSIQLSASGAPFDQARIDLCRWLDENHNGVSLTYNRSREDAHSEAIELLQRVYDQRGLNSRRWVERPGLTRFEITRILNLTFDDASLADPATGVLYPRYVVQSFLFELFNAAKQWVLTRSDEVRRGLTEQNPGLNVNSDEFAQRLADACRDFEPEPGYPFYFVPIPIAFRETLHSTDRQCALWRIAQELRCFVLQRVASAAAHRAATYFTLLDFGHFGSTETWSSLATGLLDCWDAESIRAKYSRRYLERIRDEAIAVAHNQMPGTDPAELARLVREAMRSPREPREESDIDRAVEECRLRPTG